MCGIVGLCEARRDKPVQRDLLERATDTLRHRGPDGRGILVDENVGLGHRRLSIIDLDGGAQPIFNEDRSIAVVLNGEIYNYRELRAQLVRLGHRFATESDTEVIVHAYEEHGPACVQSFVGMFGLAIWDRRVRQVLVFRDRLGVKPLFYWQRDGRFAFASELKALLEDPALRRELNPAALDDYLAHGYVPGDRCILRDVQKLAPGHYLRWQDGRLETRQYWDVRFAADESLDEASWRERTEALLRDSIRLRLRADVPLGVFLSGGVDSSAVTALAAQELGRPLKTFSVGFREADFDELAYARLVAERYQTEHHELLVNEQDVDVLADLAWHLDEPFADPSALPTYYICKAARQHVTVCLSGDGGDELFAGYNRYRQALKYEPVNWVPAGLRSAVGSAVLALTPTHVTGRGLVQRLASSGAQRYLAQMSPFSLDERRALLAPLGTRVVDPTARLFEPYFSEAGRRELVTTLQHVDQKNYLPDDILVKADRMSMAVALELREPLLDHRLVEAANAMPLDLKFRNDQGKYLLKAVLAEHVPAEALHRRKKGFGLPIRHWFRDSLHAYAQELLLSPTSRARGYLSAKVMRRIVGRHSAGLRDFSRKIWALLMLEHWCRRYGL